MKVSEHFDSKEFECKCGCGKFIQNDELINLLECIRATFDSSIKINSGTRCEKHNKEEDGAEDSQHLFGTAADIVVKGVSADLVQAKLKSWFPDSHGIGSYDNFTHIDVRKEKARW